MTLTDQQQMAVTTTGRSLIVSAAAGSGKTSVLARRCAYLVCDAPPEERCDVDELLVLTFTDAAAAEMRGRITESIRARWLEEPDNERLERQAVLVDSARISTIHSFCRWVIRRWFCDAGVGPEAPVIDGDEENLLKREVRDALFARLYSDQPDAGSGGEADPPPIAAGFVKLVDDYGLGNDRAVGELVGKLADFTGSLPEPDDWLREAKSRITAKPDLLVCELADDLKTELLRQSEHCVHLADDLLAGDQAGHFHGEQIREYAEKAEQWASDLSGSEEPESKDDSGVREKLALFDKVCLSIREFAFSRSRAPKLSKEALPAQHDARDCAKGRFKHVRERLFRDRIKNRLCLFSTEEWVSGLARIAPYVRTIADLVDAFRESYSRRKKQLGVLDFSDLERFAFDILRDSDRRDEPSDIAATLQRRFAHVLVDEFQDVNPIQQAIIRLVSRETDPNHGDNLFAVGDVKQSIYRFRLAEPALFTERLDSFRDPVNAGVAIHLQDNFRSRSEILETVNLVFQQLMRKDVGDVHYDEQAFLSPGRTDDDAGKPQPVELHLLERRIGKVDLAEETEEQTEEQRLVDPLDPSQWQPIEREAYLIGSRINELMREGAITPDGNPLRYRDCAVLLRAASLSARNVASVLTKMGIPAYADAGGSLLGALEIRDVRAALEVLDNMQQDIPLAAVLRSGVMGLRLSENDLVAIRCLDGRVPFHEAVRQYARLGEDERLKLRLQTILERLGRFRSDIRRRPVADVLRRIYDETGYLAYVGGLPNGHQRRANLLKLHDRAGQFGTFRKQGLHRFLRFLEMLEEQGQDLGPAPALGEAQDVVTIMSIHHSKGLEFPVVFVAGLGRRFNLADRSGRMVFERDTGIGLRVVEPERMIEYPSAAHVRITGSIERHTRAEEMRILYVAMTRAREKLILLGSVDGLEGVGNPPAPERKQHLSSLQITSALTPLDWLVPAFTACRTGQDSVEGRFEVHSHMPEQIVRWRLDHHAGGGGRSLGQTIVSGLPLPESEPRSSDDPRVEKVLDRVDYVYPSLALASVRAVVAASEFKGDCDYQHNPEQREDAREVGETFTVPPSKYLDKGSSGGAIRRGIITHRVLQHLDFQAARDRYGVASELQRIRAERIVSADEIALIDQGGVAWFVATPLAEVIREAGECYRREFSFVAAEAPEFFDPLVESPGDDTVLVRGIVDGVLPVEDGIEIIDFKTDAVGERDVADRSQRYRPQMTMYARAMERIWRTEVRAKRLVFLAARQIVTLDGAG